MKLGTIRNGTRDGKLVIVSRDLTRAVSAEAIAPTMQAALDDWKNAAPKLVHLYDELNANRVAGAFDFDESAAEAPLPRAYQWIDGSVYLSHYRRIKRSMGLTDEQAPPPEIPIMYQGTGDDFKPPHSDLALPDEAHEIDFELELAVITDDVPMGVSAQDARSHIKLLGLLNDVSLRGLIAGELGTGFGPITAKPSCVIAPVFITPDELGDKWTMKGINLPAQVELNGKPFGWPNAAGMRFGFDQLIARAATTRRLGAGTVIGSGTVSSDEPNVGYCCIAERRAVELVEHGAYKTEFMKFGDRFKLSMEDNGVPVFGTISQKVVKAGPAAAQSISA
jgi:fumarylacetoacetate (FAA) hydrolase